MVLKALGQLELTGNVNEYDMVKISVRHQINLMAYTFCLKYIEK